MLKLKDLVGLSLDELRAKNIPLADLTRFRDEARDNAHGIVTRADGADLAGDDAALFDELATLAERLGEIVGELQARNQRAAQLVAATRGEGGLTIDRGLTGTDGGHRAPTGLDRAKRTVESLHTRGLLPDRSAEIVQALATRDQWAQQWVAAAGDDAYTRAFGKLLTDPTRGHMRWDAEESAAYRRVEALRDAQRAMSLTDTAGGHMVPLSLDPAIILTNAGNVNPIRQMARTVTITGTEWRGVSSAGTTAEWLDEADEAADGSPTLAQPTVTAHKYSCFVPFSVEIEGDGMQFVSELQKVMTDAVDNLHATAFVTGSGSAQPVGIITALAAASPSVTVAGVGSEALAASDFYNVQNALPPRYQANAQWAANLAILNTARQFETAGGALKFPGLQNTPPTLLGRAVNEVSNMDGAINPAATESNRVVVYGDWSNYVIADRVGTSAELVQHLVGDNGRPTGERGLWLWGRVGADSVNDNAFRVLNVATTA